jgi:alanine racemase
MTHLASAEDHRQDEFTSKQIERFEGARDAFRASGHDPEWIHVANSPGAIGHPRSRGNLVRLGGALYGLLDDILEPDAVRPALTPILSLRSEIADIKDIPVGETLGYGRTFRTQRNSRIALVPVGYADGLPRVLSTAGRACVAGISVPIVGRISMDWTMLDVTDVTEAKVGDTVTMIGRDGDCEIKASDIARQADTIAYEITCGIGPRVRRVYL